MSIVLGLATVLAEAHAAETGPSAAAPAPRVEKYTPPQAAKPAAERAQKPPATLAVTFTDDADSVRLPAFAMRMTPLPERFLRVGVEWRF